MLYICVPEHWICDKSTIFAWLSTSISANSHCWYMYTKLFCCGLKHYLALLVCKAMSWLGKEILKFHMFNKRLAMMVPNLQSSLVEGLRNKILDYFTNQREVLATIEWRNSMHWKQPTICPLVQIGDLWLAVTSQGQEKGVSCSIFVFDSDLNTSHINFEYVASLFSIAFQRLPDPMSIHWGPKYSKNLKDLPMLSLGSKGSNRFWWKGTRRK